LPLAERPGEAGGSREYLAAVVAAGRRRRWGRDCASTPAAPGISQKTSTSTHSRLRRAVGAGDGRAGLVTSLGPGSFEVANRRFEGGIIDHRDDNRSLSDRGEDRSGTK
jgi:hypothetical protein